MRPFIFQAAHALLPRHLDKWKERRDELRAVANRLQKLRELQAELERQTPPLSSDEFECLAKEAYEQLSPSPTLPDEPVCSPS